MQYSYQFTKKERLLKAQEYRFVFEQACRSSDQYFTVLARVNLKNGTRLGLAIAKKRVKLAVDRSRIKRLIRESFRINQLLLSDLDCVVLANKQVNQVNNHILLQSLKNHWLTLLRRCKKS